MKEILEKIRDAKQVLECGYDINENSLKESDAYGYLTEAELLCGQFEQQVNAILPKNLVEIEGYLVDIDNIVWISDIYGDPSIRRYEVRFKYKLTLEVPEGGFNRGKLIELWKARQNSL